MAKRASSTKKLAADELAVVVLNVGDGDAIVVRFPPAHNAADADGRVLGAVVDCYDGAKTIEALKSLGIDELAFVCATHPHADHIRGMETLITWCLKENKPVQQYWDSGFRHVSVMQYRLIRLLAQNPGIRFIQPTSGYECIVNHVRVQVLSPSIMLKNRYDTFGTNINNASVVIKLEYPAPDIAQRFVARKDAEEKRLSRQELLKQNTIILGADAQFDAWARITEEFPTLQRTSNPGQLIDPRHIHRPLRCQVLKVPHHMSKHGVSLEVLETIGPSYIIASCDNASRHGFPHALTVMAAEDIKHGKGGKGWIRYTGHPEVAKRSGSIMAVLKGSGRPSVRDLREPKGEPAPL